MDSVGSSYGATVSVTTASFFLHDYIQDVGSGLKPDSIRSVDPYPYSDPNQDPDPGGQKRSTKVEKNRNFMF